MKNNHRSWTFINQNDPSKSIVVHDPHSAECLQALLHHHEEWVLMEAVKPKAIEKAPERSEETPLAQKPPPVPAPPLPQMPPPPAPEFKGQDRRAQPRFKTEFRVVLITGAHSYRNTSEDVSMGGMKLRRAVPQAFLSQKCTIFVAHPDLRENVQISCRVLADPSDPRRIQFTETDQKQLRRLEEWLAESAVQNKGVA